MRPIEVEPNPNCRESDQFFFTELEAPRAIRGIYIEEKGRRVRCDVTGVDKDRQWVGAQAVKITDSGAGYAWLIFGGSWGIRLRPEAYAGESWDLNNSHQWGEPFKIYGEKEDILFTDRGV